MYVNCSKWQFPLILACVTALLEIFSWRSTASKLYPFRYHSLHWHHRLWRGHMAGRRIADTQRQERWQCPGSSLLHLQAWPWPSGATQQGYCAGNQWSQAARRGHSNTQWYRSPQSRLRRKGVGHRQWGVQDVMGRCAKYIQRDSFMKRCLS